MSLKQLSFLFSFSGFLSALSFSTPIWMVFMTSYQHFSIETAINLSMITSFVMAVFEVWSGAWSDRFGRRGIFFLGVILEIVAIIVYIFGHSLVGFIVSAICMGLGWAMMSGNIEAIVHDTLSKMRKEAMFAKMQSETYSWLFVGRAAGAILGGYLFLIHPVVPYVANLLIAVFSLGIIFLFPGETQNKSTSKNDFEHILIGFRDLLKHKSMLFTLGIIILISSFSNIYWFTYQEYFQILGISVWEFGWLYALASIVSAVSAWILGRLFNKKYSLLMLIKIIAVLFLITTVFFAFSQELWSLLGLLTVSFVSGWIMTLGNTLVLGSVTSTHKSFAVSAFSFIMTLGYVLCTVLAGFFVTSVGLEQVYLWLPVCGIIVIILAFLQKKI